jgi:hydrogenase maturation protease
MRRILVAGIGNVFLGDDGFGVEVAGQLAARPQPEGVEVADYGIRGFDLACAMTECDVAVLIDAIPRGKDPGTIFVLEPDMTGDMGGGDVLNAHGLNPLEVFRLVRRFGRELPPTYLVGCEPSQGEEVEEAMALSPAVAASVDGAVELVESLLARLIEEPAPAEPAAPKES